MFHKYDFGTAHQITSRRWSNEDLEPEVSKHFPIAVTVLVVEVCAIVVLLVIPQLSKNAFAPRDHKVTAHTHHAIKHVGYRAPELGVG